MRGRCPEIEPYDHGTLDVGDGHQVYWETCGNPDGEAALVVRGGPGSGCTARTLSNLAGTPWLLANAWPDAEPVIVDDVGHGGGSALTSALVAATDRFGA
jgi:hypothetical protein